jgi:hypothetical protein
MKRHQSTLWIALVILVLLTGCSASESSLSEPSTEDSYAYEKNAGTANQENSKSSESGDTAQESNLQIPSIGAPGEIDRKIIREQFIEQEVKDLKTVIADIEGKLLQMEGAYMQDMQEWKIGLHNSETFHAQLIMRVPVNQLASFVSYIEQQGNVLRRNQTGQDVTAEFIDNESRLRNLTAYEDRLLKLYEKAENIEDMLKIESELTRIREPIEQIEGRQKYLTEVTSTAKITLELFEVKEYDFIQGQDSTSVLTQAWVGLQKSLVFLASFGQGLFIVFVASLPFLFILLAVGVLIYVILKKRIAKRNQKEAE